MEKNRERNYTKILGKTILVWLITACAVLPILSALAQRLVTKQTWLGWISSLVLLCAAAAASHAAVSGIQNSVPLLTVFSTGLILSVLLLMIGFLINADALSAAGAGRVILACFGGAALGALTGKTKRTKTGKGRFSPRRSS